MTENIDTTIQNIKEKLIGLKQTINELLKQKKQYEEILYYNKQANCNYVEEIHKINEKLEGLKAEYNLVSDQYALYLEKQNSYENDLDYKIDWLKCIPKRFIPKNIDLKQKKNNYKFYIKIIIGVIILESLTVALACLNPACIMLCKILFPIILSLILPIISHITDIMKQKKNINNLNIKNLAQKALTELSMEISKNKGLKNDLMSINAFNYPQYESIKDIKEKIEIINHKLADYMAEKQELENDLIQLQSMQEIMNPTAEKQGKQFSKKRV